MTWRTPACRPVPLSCTRCRTSRRLTACPCWRSRSASFAAAARAASCFAAMPDFTSSRRASIAAISLAMRASSSCQAVISASSSAIRAERSSVSRATRWRSASDDSRRCSSNWRRCSIPEAVRSAARMARERSLAFFSTSSREVRASATVASSSLACFFAAATSAWICSNDAVASRNCASTFVTCSSRPDWVSCMSARRRSSADWRSATRSRSWERRRCCSRRASSRASWDARRSTAAVCARWRDSRSATRASSCSCTDCMAASSPATTASACASCSFAASRRRR